MNASEIKSVEQEMREVSEHVLKLAKNTAHQMQS